MTMRALLPVGAIQIVQQHVSTRNTVLYGCTTTPAQDFFDIINTSSSKPFEALTNHLSGNFPDLKALICLLLHAHIDRSSVKVLQWSLTIGIHTVKYPLLEVHRFPNHILPILLLPLLHLITPNFKLIYILIYLVVYFSLFVASSPL